METYRIYLRAFIAGWTRGVAMDVDFDVPCALLHDVPSLDAVLLAAGPDVV